MNASSPKFESGSGPAAQALLALYSLGLGVALVAALPWWARELGRGGKYREGLRERLGFSTWRPLFSSGARRARTPSVQTIWVHAVSVGEVLAVAPLVAALREGGARPRVLVSTTTRTGQALARARFGATSVFYFPLDFAFAVRAWLLALRPSLIVLVESELWPRLLHEAARARVPVAVVNGRISPRSWPRYRRLGLLWRPLLRSLALVQAQSGEDAARFGALGARGVTVGGNLKYDLPLAAPSPLLAELRQHLPARMPVLVCGSTLAGEEQLLLRSVPEDTVVLLAPRHPERFDEVAALLAVQNQSWFRLSAWRGAPCYLPPGTVLLLDSVGELAALYALATVAVVGGGFLHRGGHNPLEPAALGKPVVIGPQYANFAESVGILRQADAGVVAEAGELSSEIARLLQLRMRRRWANAPARRARRSGVQPRVPLPRGGLCWPGRTLRPVACAHDCARLDADFPSAHAALCFRASVQRLGVRTELSTGTCPGVTGNQRRQSFCRRRGQNAGGDCFSVLAAAPWCACGFLVARLRPALARRCGKGRPER